MLATNPNSPPARESYLKASSALEGVGQERQRRNSDFLVATKLAILATTVTLAASCALSQGRCSRRKRLLRKNLGIVPDVTIFSVAGIEIFGLGAGGRRTAS